MTCAFATWDGAYVLGALSPTDRDEFERHLDGCPACAASVRGLAGLPGLLSRVEEQALDGPAEPVPATLLPRLVRELRRDRQRRARVAIALAAAAVVTVVAGVATVAGLGESPVSAPPTIGTTAAGSPPAGASPDGASLGAASRPMAPVGGVHVKGWLTLETVPWGTRLTLRCSYGAEPHEYGDAEPDGYVMVVRTRDGEEQEVATWNAVPGGAVQLTAATAAGRGDIESVEVRSDTGRPLLRLRG